MGAASAGKVYTVGYGHYNMGAPIQARWSFKKKFNDDLTQSSSTIFALLMRPLSSQVHRPGQGGGGAGGHEAQELQRRGRDAQDRPPAAAGPVHLEVAKGGRQVPYDAENTGYTFAPVKYYEPYVASTPTSCQMKRPS
jgi:branched-chain amino acid transport system substrate-binding protein